MKGLKVKTLIFAVACLCMAFSTTAFASTLSWHNTPISGINVDYSIPGQLTINTDPILITIPTYVGPDPSKTVFLYNPVVCCNNGQLYDPSVAVWFASAVNVDPLDSYHYAGVWSFLGSGPYSFTWPENDWNPGTGFTIAELYSSVNNFWASDAGPWQYTETWTGTSGADLGVSITSTKDFFVGTQAQIPEPASMLLLGSGLLGLALLRKLKK